MFTIIIACASIIITSISSCKKNTAIPKGMVECPWDISIPVPITTNNLTSKMKIYDTLKFSINVPFKNFNLANNDSIDLSIFSDLWGGALIVRNIHDSISKNGVNDIGARSEFSMKTELNIFETNDKNSTNQTILFKYKKTINAFQITLNLIPQQKGTFQIVFLSSAFRDAFCGNSLKHSFVNYRSNEFYHFIEEAIGRKLVGDDPYQYIPENYVIRVE
jgi:hypothetical protein